MNANSHSALPDYEGRQSENDQHSEPTETEPVESMSVDDQEQISEWADEGGATLEGPAHGH